MPSLQDYLDGKPLTPELAELAAGRDMEAAADEAAEQVAAFEIDDPMRPLDDGEREDLRRLRFEPGWRVLERLRKRTCMRLTDAAMMASKVDPLRNQEKIAAGWAQLSIYEQALQSEASLVEFEVQQLKKPKKKDAGDEDDRILAQ
jgi:hypothetical protein